MGGYTSNSYSITNTPNPRRHMGGYVTHCPTTTFMIDGGTWGGYVWRLTEGGTSGASCGEGVRRRRLTEGSIAYSDRGWSIFPLRVRYDRDAAKGLTSVKIEALQCQ